MPLSPSTTWVTLDAYDLYLRALAEFHKLSLEGPSTTLTAEVFPARNRGVANGVV
jgi:hypothetical protein